MNATQIAQEAVRRAFKDKDIFDDAFHGTEFSSLDRDQWEEIITEVLVEQGDPDVDQNEILSECRRLYKEQRRNIRDRMKALKDEIEKEVKG